MLMTLDALHYCWASHYNKMEVLASHGRNQAEQKLPCSVAVHIQMRSQCIDDCRLPMSTS